MLIDTNKIETVKDPENKGRDFQSYDVPRSDPKGKRRLILKEFRDNSEFMEFIREGEYGHQGDSSDSWAFGYYKNREKTHMVIDTGDLAEKVLKRVMDYRSELEFTNPEIFSDTGVSMKRRRRFRDDGDELDFDRIMSGVPEYWQNVERDTERKAITLGLNMTMSCGNDEDDFAEITAMAVILADALTKKGVATRIMLCSAGWDNLIMDDRCECSVNFTLKDFEEPLDTKRVGLLFAQGLFRDSIFGIFDEGFYDQRSTWNMGKALETSEAMLEFMGIDYMIAKQWRQDAKGRSEYAQELITQVMEG